MHRNSGRKDSRKTSPHSRSPSLAVLSVSQSLSLSFPKLFVRLSQSQSPLFYLSSFLSLFSLSSHTRPHTHTHTHTHTSTIIFIIWKVYLKHWCWLQCSIMHNVSQCCCRLLFQSEIRAGVSLSHQGNSTAERSSAFCQKVTGTKSSHPGSRNYRYLSVCVCNLVQELRMALVGARFCLLK